MFFDELWVCSDFVHAAASSVTDLPLRYLPHPVEIVGEADSSAIDWLNLGDRFVYLSVFDCAGNFKRKNPVAAIEAFRQAFPDPGGEDGPLLVVKTRNGRKHPGDLLLLRTLAHAHADIRIVDRHLEDAEMAALMQRADCFVSLHRSEALGRTLMESMARGKPCLATGYSGNLQYMNSANSFLCPHKMVRIGRGSHPYPAAGHWAEPDVTEAARLMREIDDCREEADKRARGAAATMQEKFAVQVVGAVISRHLEEIGDRSSGVEAKKLPLVSTRQRAFSLLKEELRQGKLGNFHPSGLFRVHFSRILELFGRYDSHQRKAQRAILKALKESEDRGEERIRELEVEIERLTEIVDLLAAEKSERSRTETGTDPSMGSS